MREKYLEQIRPFLDWIKRKPKNMYWTLGIGMAGVFSIVYFVSRATERDTHVFHNEVGVSFEGSRILGNTDSIYKRRDDLLSKNVKKLEQDVKATGDQIAILTQKVDQMNQIAGSGKTNAQMGTDAQKIPPQFMIGQSGQGQSATAGALRSEPAPTAEAPLENLAIRSVGSSVHVGSEVTRSGGSRFYRNLSAGPSVITFPVKGEISNVDTVVLPSGSYVKAKMLTGVEAPEGRNYPVLLQMDYAFIGPNQSKIDLSGCFGIAKAQGDLSTERVQMQFTKMSCVSKAGKMFEREANGFVADHTDNSFAVIGIVNSKQDRVITSAFLSSIVEGVGKAIQQSQTTQSATPLGGAQSMVTGDQAKYIGAGGAANAASMVTQWYLQQAQHLLPTINIGSGHDVWVVMQDKMELPNWYFKKTSDNKSDVFSYISRFSEQ